MAQTLSSRYPHLRQLLTEATSATGQLRPAYLRNFRELVKLLPIVGSWLDANTLGALQDLALEERLQKLEEASTRAITATEEIPTLESLSDLNAHFYLLFALYQHQIFSTNSEILNTLRTYLPIPPGAAAPLMPHEDFRLFILAGPSATGKDVLLDLLLKHPFASHPHAEALVKYTTRRRRHSDSRYYRFLTAKQFATRRDRGDVLFPYYKRQHQYGFEKQHLFRAATTPALMFMIFTEFSMLPTAQAFLQEQGICTTSVLLTAPQEHLVHRSWFRSFPEREVRQRIDSITEDLHFLDHDSDWVADSFSHVVYNGDDRSKRETLSEMVNIINSVSASGSVSSGKNTGISK